MAEGNSRPGNKREAPQRSVETLTKSQQGDQEVAMAVVGFPQGFRHREEEAGSSAGAAEQGLHRALLRAGFCIHSTLGNFW